MQKNSVKTSIVYSGLVGTGGLFIAKMIGLVYAIPFSSILANSSYMGIYGQAYAIYTYILTVFTAGFPFAIATLVARYTVLQNRRAIFAIKRLSIGLLGVMGLFGMLLLLMLAHLLGPVMVAKNSEDMIIVLRLLAIAIFFVPILSGYRGYYQGLKEMQEYAFSQVVEQLLRVGFLLSAAFLIVYVLHMETKWALYVSVLSTTVAAIAGLVQIIHFDKQNEKAILAQNQWKKTPSVNVKALLKEFFILAIPYMVTAVLGYSQQLFNSILLPMGIKAYYHDAALTTSIISASSYVGVKILAIPLVIAPGFTAAIAPHITSAITTGNQSLVKKNVMDCLSSVLYLGIPISLCLFFYAAPLNHTLFYVDNLSVYAMVLRWLTIEALTGVCLPVVTNLLISLGLKRYVMRLLVMNTVLKGLLMWPLGAFFGFGGTVIASFIADGLFLAIGIGVIFSRYQIPLRWLFVRLGLIFGSSLVMGLCALVLSRLGLSGLHPSRWFSLIQLMINGLLSLGIYLVLTWKLKLPQAIFSIRK